MPTKHRLAHEAIHIERNILKENVGSQDQVAVSYGGLNKISFNHDGDFNVEPIIIDKERLARLEGHLMLFFTGFSRIASKIAKKQIRNTANKRTELSRMHELVDEARNILASKADLDKFGRLMSESWNIKKTLSDRISNPAIDAIYDAAIKGGAAGGKLLGAGGGGFILFFVRPDLQERVRDRLKKLLRVKFRFDSFGSQIIFYHDSAMVHKDR